MSLIVETGVGLANADAYVGLVHFKEFCSARGYRWEDAEDFAIENSIRRATDYIDTIGRYKGARLVPAQALEFPRSDLTDWSDYTITGVPHRVKHACCELAFKGLSEPLYKDLDRGGKVVSESVGPISVTYAGDAPAGKLFMFAKNLLEPYLRDPDTILYEPMNAPAYEGNFARVGMMDNPGAGALTSYSVDDE
jgi:hypothetical protein